MTPHQHPHPAVEAHNLHKIYDDDSTPVHALRDVDLSIAHGEFVAVMGPSGCGKSTLLHLLGALTTPTEGTVKLDGRDVSTLDDDQLAQVRRTQIGIVFQAFNLVPVLTARENIALPATIAGTQARHRIDDLLASVGLVDKANTRPHKLSGGEQQRVAIARALTLEPALLLADEPTGNLDTDTSRDIVKLLRQLNTNGQTIILVTHDPKIASQASRILFLRDGSIVREVEPNRAPTPLATPLFDFDFDAD